MVLEMKMDKLFLLENIASVVVCHIFVELILTISASEEAHEFIRGRNASGNSSIK